MLPNTVMPDFSFAMHVLGGLTKKSYWRTSGSKIHRFLTCILLLQGCMIAVGDSKLSEDKVTIQHTGPQTSHRSCLSDGCIACESSKSKINQREAAMRMLEAYIGSRPETLLTTDKSDALAHAEREAYLDKIVQDAQTLFGHNCLFDDDELTDILLKATKSATKKHKVKTENKFVDRYVRGMIRTIHDSDCMDREFDLRDEAFDKEAAIEVFKKCKLLVLRNVFEADFLQEYRKNFTNYIDAINTNAIDPEGKTSNGEPFYLHPIDEKRWEVILPKQFAHKDLLANPTVLDILMDSGVLGPDLTLHSLGTAIAEPGANSQRWHKDADYLYSMDSFRTHGIGGHDLPSYSVTMMVPLIHNMTHVHGPTEFCMGSTWLDGFPTLLDAPLKDLSLLDQIADWMELYEEGVDGIADPSENCPPRFWRMPVLSFGDMLLFDYQITHRGGQNSSPDLRAIMYMTYSRVWYKDTNFNRDIEDLLEESSENTKWDTVLLSQLTATARFAQPNGFSCLGETNTIEDCWSGDATTVLENIPAFLAGKQPIFSEPEIAHFIVANHNINIEGGVKVVSVDKEIKVLGTIKSGEYFVAEALVGSTIEARISRGKTIRSLTVLPDQGQIVLSHSTIDLPEILKD